MSWIFIMSRLWLRVWNQKSSGYPSTPLGWSVALLASAISYFPFAFLGYVQLDQGALLVWSRLVQEGKFPYKDFPYQLPPLTLFANAMLSSVMPWLGSNNISLLWTFVTYFGVAITALRFANHLLREWNQPPLTFGAGILWTTLFFLAGPVHEPYQNYTHDGLVFAISGILFLSISFSVKHTWAQYLELLLGSLCLGLAFTAHQTIGATAIAVGVLILIAHWHQREPYEHPKILHAASLIVLFLAPAVTFVYLASQDAVNDFYYWTVVVPSQNRISIHDAVISLANFSTTLPPAFFPVVGLVGLGLGKLLAVQRPKANTIDNVGDKVVWGVGLALATFSIQGWPGVILMATLVLTTTVWVCWELWWNRSTWDILMIRGHASMARWGVWTFALMCVTLGFYIALFHEPKWLSLLSDYNFSSGWPLFAWSVDNTVRGFLIICWFFSWYTVGVAWTRAGRRAAISLALPLLGFFLIYDTALLAGTGETRLFRTLPPLVLVALLLYSGALGGVLPRLQVSRTARVVATVSLIALLVVIRLRGPTWSIADPLHRPVRYYAPLPGLVDYTVVSELETAQSIITEADSSLFVYQADPIFYYFLDKSPPSIAVIHDAHQGVRNSGWDERELDRLRSSHVSTILTYSTHQREDTFLFRKKDPIRDWIEVEFQPVFSGKFIIVWRRKSDLVLNVATHSDRGNDTVDFSVHVGSNVNPQ